MMKKICVIGLGYIGLPTSVMFANNGFEVHGVDVNDSVIDSLSKGEVHIIEPGLKELLNSAIEKQTFTVSKTPTPADIYIIAVPSPINENKTANLRYVEEATKSIVPVVEKGNLVILESTVPPRTVEDVMIPILKETGLAIGDELYISHSPERVIPGKVFTELVENDRIVGGINSVSSDMTVELYETFVKGKIHITDATTAELVKVIENTYRDINIAFANELAKISDQIGVNVWEAINFANFHPRVNIHLPGPGVGGHCIAVDPWFLVEKQPDLANIIHLARNTNDSMPSYTAERAKLILESNGTPEGKVAVLGLAFKANIDDMRESPSMEVIKHLRSQGVRFTAYDPHASKIEFAEQTGSFEEAAADADLLLILTDHQVFKELDLNEVKKLVSSPVVFDTKNCIDRIEWERNEFKVYKLGDSKNS
ncbi:nucleotide sugar dehydrogenase [Jeotgalibacillus sp. ET6]|uniref:nucleotide sugar dehydrogenase n=1 Tax=Jeotgalibacillus sp. ET6 TaxID=3037260 RepID=UPI002418837F|nr:nucleotide sugar dehydrogenase [Jeotgalibacillus sp. ET6]MDG5471577.1 nucleotide sugar dehydrogenase [Jeotgalibacillus sp. ET6]